MTLANPHALLDRERGIGAAHGCPYPTGMHAQHHNRPVSDIGRHEAASQRVERCLACPIELHAPLQIVGDRAHVRGHEGERATVGNERQQPTRETDRRDGVRVHERANLLRGGNVGGLVLGPGDAGVDENEAEAAAGQTRGERVDAFRPVKVHLLDHNPPSEAATSSTSSVAAAALRAVAVTRQPRRANSRASPRPKPREAPTMIAVLLWSWSGAAVAMVLSSIVSR